MVLRIDSASTIANIQFKPIRKSDLKENETVTNPINSEEISGVPKSYITFKAKEETKPIAYTEEAKILLNKSLLVAKRYGHSELQPAHVIQAAIEETEEKVAQLDDAIIESDIVESVSPLNKLLNDYSKKNMLSNDESRTYMMDMIADLKEDNEQYLNTISKGENVDILKIEMSKDFDSLMRESVKNIPAVSSFVLLGVAINTMTNRGIEYAAESLKEAMSFGSYKSTEDIASNYLKAYDTRAIDAWNKLALGSNLNVTYEDAKEGDRLVASILNTIDSPKYGNFNSENTQIYAMSDNLTDTQLLEEVMFQKESNPDVQKIFLVDMNRLLANSVQENGEVSFVNGLVQAINGTDEKLRLVFLQSNDVYYQMVKDSKSDSMYSNFVTYAIPPIQTYEAKHLITKEMMKSVPTPFTRDGINRAIYHSANMKGTFPDKAIDLMKRMSIYYGNSKKKISSKDVDEFAQIAHEIFNKAKSDVVYDTGKNLSDMYGKETVKKDIEAIVRQIQTGKIGTKGMIIYSKDQEAGSGRQFTAEAIAGEAQVPFVAINTSDFAVSDRDSDGDSTESPKDAMSRVFLEAKKAARQNQHKTAIIYVNNFEEFAFSGPYLPGYKQAMSQLSEEMQNAVDEDVNILVIGSTDEYYANAIPEVLRGFNQTLIVDSPRYSKKSREEIISHRIKDIGLPLAYKSAEEKQNFIKKLVKMTEYMSFVELKSLVDKTQQIMLERGKNKASTGDFVEGYLQLATGRTSHPEMPDFNKAATTSHECGHATNLEVMNDILRRFGKPWHKSHDVNFITLDPRGDFLGAVFEGKEDNTDYPFEAMFTALVCSFGGYSCEKMFFGMDGSAGIAQDLAQATAAVKRGVEYFGLGFNTGKISNAVGLKSGKFYESVYNDIDIILANAQVASDLITETYKRFNEWFTKKYSKLIGTDDCMVDGDDFRKALKTWRQKQPKRILEEINIMEEMIMDLISCSKNGKKYPTVIKKIL